MSATVGVGRDRAAATVTYVGKILAVVGVASDELLGIITIRVGSLSESL